MFIRLLRFTLSEGDALSALRVAIEWGRYGDLFEYDFNTGILNIPKNEDADSA
jgi:NitT/TauT family transport system ATP-binding protein